MRVDPSVAIATVSLNHSERIVMSVSSHSTRRLLMHLCLLHFDSSYSFFVQIRIFFHCLAPGKTYIIGEIKKRFRG